MFNNSTATFVLTVSQHKHLVSFVKVPSNISWTQVFSCFPVFCAWFVPLHVVVLAVVPTEETLPLLLTLLVLLCFSFSFSRTFSPVLTEHNDNKINQVKGSHSKMTKSFMHTNEGVNSKHILIVEIKGLENILTLQKICYGIQEVI